MSEEVREERSSKPDAREGMRGKFPVDEMAILASGVSLLLFLILGVSFWLTGFNPNLVKPCLLTAWCSFVTMNCLIMFKYR